MISKEDVVKYCEMIYETINKFQLDITYFEIVTMIAFLYFSE